MKTRLPNSVFSFLTVALLGSMTLASELALVAAQNQIPSNRNAQVYPKRPVSPADVGRLIQAN